MGTCQRRRPGALPSRILLFPLLVIAIAAAAAVGLLPPRGLPPVATTLVAQSTDPAVVGQWAPPFNAGVQGIHLHLLPNGKVLAFGRDTDQAKGEGPRIWNPATETFDPNPPLTNVDLFCAGHSFLPDGKLFIASGHTRTCIGVRETNIFDWQTGTFSPGPLLLDRRWYPTNTTLPNGEVVVVSGATALQGDCNPGFPTPEVYNPATNTFRYLTTGERVQDLYPFMYVAPNGKVFSAGRLPDTQYLDTSGTGQWTFVAQTVSNLDREEGTSVMYDAERGKVFIAGGGAKFDYIPVDNAEVIDLSAPTPQWRMLTSRMDQPRRHVNSTILPDGKVFLSGGQNCGGFDDAACPVLTTLMWDPATEQFSVMASLVDYQGYHNSAILLPDGRVLKTNGDLVNFRNWQIYSPPYLFKGARPTISSAPADANYGTTIAVNTPDAASVTAVHLLRHGSVTHVFDQDQRIVRPSFTRGTGVVNVTIPSSGNIAPPGYYMIFILTGTAPDLVPSVGKPIRIGGAAPPPPPAPAAPSNLTATTIAATTIRLTWADNASNEDRFEIERAPDGVTFSKIAEVGPDTTTHDDTGLRRRKTFTYRVRACNAGGCSAYSNTATGST